VLKIFVDILLLSENNFGFPSNRVRIMKYFLVHVCVAVFFKLFLGVKMTP